jgi:hypothetical protein
MKTLIVLALLGLAAAQLQVQLHHPNHQQRLPQVQIQTPNFDEQWQDHVQLPEWIRNNPLWQHEPMPEPEPEWNQRPHVRPERPTRPAPEGHDWNQGNNQWQQVQPLPEWNVRPQPEWNVRPEPQPNWNVRPEPQPLPEWIQPNPQPRPDWRLRPQPQPEWNTRPEPQPQPRPEWIQRPQPQPLPEVIQPPTRHPIIPQPPQWQPVPRTNNWRDGHFDERCPLVDDHEGHPVFLPGSDSQEFYICWGSYAWPFECPGNSVFRTEVDVCADPGWEPENQRNNNWNNQWQNGNNQWQNNNNNWQRIRPFVEEEKPEPY